MDKQASSFDDWMDEEDEVEAKSNLITISAYKMPYVATPKDDKGGPLIVKAITLEEITNVNGWRVVPEEFERVAAQYRDGRQLRLNHSKDVQEIIGKSFDSKVLIGKDVSAYMGKEFPSLNLNGKYVVTEFEADPQDPQVRTNILRGYVDTGSIGLDAKAWCDECGKPLEMEGDDMIRTCHHLEAGVKLTETDVKEYSYVSEPAYPHSFILPTFAAAISKLPKPRESSLSYIPAQAKVEMSVEAKDPKVEATAAKKAEEEKPEEDAQALAEKFISYYKKGVADADARHMKESEAGASVVAQKTDQVAKVAEAKTGEEGQKNLYEQRWGARKSYSKADLIALTQTPTAFALDADPAIRELFKAAAEHPKAPSEVKASYRAWKTAYPGRFE